MVAETADGSWRGFVGVVPEAGTWQEVVIPLSDLQVTDTVISGIIIQTLDPGAGNTYAPFHVDDISLLKPGP